MSWTIVGITAASLTMFGFVPQIIKMWKTQSVKDVSGIALGLYLRLNRSVQPSP